MAFPTSSKGVAAKVSGAVPGGAVEDAAVSLFSFPCLDPFLDALVP